MTYSFDMLETDAGWDDQPTVTEFGTEDTVAALDRAPQTLLQPGAMVGEYEVEQLVAEGGMAQVFTAIHPLIGRRVAIKVLSDADPTATARFVQEARTVNRIGHDNIVDVFSLGTLSDGRPYMVLEWLEGRDMAYELAEGPLSIEDAIDTIDQIADALQAAHRAGVAHRDLKPDNVFVLDTRGRREVKLLDFGIAKLVGDQKAPRHTQAGMMVGTPGYVSPEQARGLELDYRTDIYSLGIVAYQILCGRLPFDGDCDMDIVVRQLRDDPAPPSQYRRDVPTRLDSLVRRMIERDPDHRPGLTEVRATLSQLRAARYAKDTATQPIADIPSLATSKVKSNTPTPRPKFRAVGTPAPSAQLPEVRVTFHEPSADAARRDEVTKTSLVALPEMRSWKTRLLLAGGAAAFTATVAIVTAYLA